MHIGGRSLHTATALASVLQFLVLTCLLHTRYPASELAAMPTLARIPSHCLWSQAHGGVNSGCRRDTTPVLRTATHADLLHLLQLCSNSCQLLLDPQTPSAVSKPITTPHNVNWLLLASYTICSTLLEGSMDYRRTLLPLPGFPLLEHEAQFSQLVHECPQAFRQRQLCLSGQLQS